MPRTVWLCLALAPLGGCFGAHGPPADDGEAPLRVRVDVDWSVGGHGFLVAGDDGEFYASYPGDLRICDGELEAGVRDALFALLDVADLLAIDDEEDAACVCASCRRAQITVPSSAGPHRVLACEGEDGPRGELFAFADLAAEVFASLDPAVCGPERFDPDQTAIGAWFQDEIGVTRIFRIASARTMTLHTTRFVGPGQDDVGVSNCEPALDRRDYATLLDVVRGSLVVGSRSGLGDELAPSNVSVSSRVAVGDHPPETRVTFFPIAEGEAGHAELSEAIREVRVARCPAGD